MSFLLPSTSPFILSFSPSHRFIDFLHSFHLFLSPLFWTLLSFLVLCSQLLDAAEPLPWQPSVFSGAFFTGRVICGGGLSLWCFPSHVEERREDFRLAARTVVLAG